MKASLDNRLATGAVETRTDHVAESLLAEPAPLQSGRPDCLRVALLSYRSDPRVGGQGVFTSNIARALAARGHEVTILSGPPYPDVPEGVAFSAAAIKSPSFSRSSSSTTITSRPAAMSAMASSIGQKGESLFGWSGMGIGWLGVGGGMIRASGRRKEKNNISPAPADPPKARLARPMSTGVRNLAK